MDACHALGAGDAVVVRNPPPMSCRVVAATAWKVNAVKGGSPRPSGSAR